MKKLGQLFWHSGSRQIIEMLLTECDAAGVEISCGSVVSNVVNKDYFEVETQSGTFTIAGDLALVSWNVEGASIQSGVALALAPYSNEARQLIQESAPDS